MCFAISTEFKEHLDFSKKILKTFLSFSWNHSSLLLGDFFFTRSGYLEVLSSPWPWKLKPISFVLKLSVKRLVLEVNYLEISSSCKVNMLISHILAIILSKTFLWWPQHYFLFSALSVQNQNTNIINPVCHMSQIMRHVSHIRYKV